MWESKLFSETPSGSCTKYHRGVGLFCEKTAAARPPRKMHSSARHSRHAITPCLRVLCAACIHRGCIHCRALLAPRRDMHACHAPLTGAHTHTHTLAGTDTHTYTHTTHTHTHTHTHTRTHTHAHAHRHTHTHIHTHTHTCCLRL